MTLCKKGRWLAILDDEDRVAFAQQIAGGAVARLHEVCVQAGFEGGLTSTKNHAKGRCCCEQR